MKILTAALLAATIAASAGPAGAALISIGLQETGVNGSAVTTVKTGAGSAGVVGYSYGTFGLNNISAQGTTSPGTLFSNAINTSTTAAGTLTIYLTEQGITAPITSAKFLSSFTSNLIPAGWRVKETTYYSSSDALYSGTLLASHLFSSASAAVNFVDPALVGAGPYSLTEVYTIAAKAGGGTTNNTIDLTPVPEPSTLAVLGAGLLALAFLRRRFSASKI